jgi:hypothetical protein
VCVYAYVYVYVYVDVDVDVDVMAPVTLIPLGSHYTLTPYVQI